MSEQVQALEAAERAIFLHLFATGEESDETCAVCGENLRHRYHLRVGENMSEIRRAAGEAARAALAKAKGEQP